MTPDAVLAARRKWNDPAVQNEYRIAFNEGREGFFHRKSNVDNPYTGRALDGLEEAWNDGWFDAFDCAQEGHDAMWGGY